MESIAVLLPYAIRYPITEKTRTEKQALDSAVDDREAGLT
jgi:hypothetical protein